MKKYNRIFSRRLFLSMLTNPVFILVYITFCYEVSELCKYGKESNNLNILIICAVFFLVWLIVFVSRIIMERRSNSILSMPKQIIDRYYVSYDRIKIFDENEIEVEFKDIKDYGISGKYLIIFLKNKEKLILNIKDMEKYERKELKDNLKGELKQNLLYNSKCLYIAIIVMVCASLICGVSVYKSATTFNTKLAGIIREWKNQKNIEFSHNNIYEDGVEGIFEDINEEINLPKELYISDDFNLKFDSDGTITSFNTFIYGKNDKAETETFLIDYDKGNLKGIRVYLNGYANSTYSEDKLLEPLITTVKDSPIEDIVKKFNEKKYGLVYYGKRSWGFNTDGIWYVDSEGNISTIKDAGSEIIGYTVSLYVQGKQEEYAPIRLNSTRYEEQCKSIEKPKVKEKNPNEEFYLTDEIGYKLETVSAALGTRYYSLYNTVDGGETWNVLNEDPFLGEGGGASGITFIDENIGFICLSHSGGNTAELYRTEDGGKSYTKVDYPKVEVDLGGDSKFSPYDFPGMPYKEGENFNLLIGQGADGDYNGNNKALYESDDKGVTWKFAKELSNSNN